MFKGFWRSQQGGSRAQSLELETNRTVRLPRSHGGTVIRVERGLLLVTREGDGEDHVLTPGMELRLPDAGLSVAWALEASRIQVRQATRPGTLPHSGRPMAAAA